ncbi:hypothetical protein K438DRAFT_1941424 [Mycena galopus ATCC 62051]|nr:hypothetical protein K438DRAFT_1941424 [Mycena galopus ATCC 62051]
MSAKESKNALSRVRNDFTATEEQDLVEFLADYEPSARTSVFPYRELADKPCGSKHSAESWQSRYKRFRPVYDVRIEGFILQNSLPPAHPTDEDEESNPERVRKKPRLQYERASPPDDETFGDLPISFDHFMKNSNSVSQRDQWIGLNLAVKFLGEAHGIEPEVVYATWERSRDLTVTATHLRERDDDGDGVAILHTRDSESRDSGNDASKPAPKTHKRKRTSPPDTPDEDVLPSLPIPKSRRRAHGRNWCPDMEVVPTSEPGEREFSFPTSPMAPTDQGRNVEVQGPPRRPEHAPSPDAPDDSDLDSEPSALPPEVHPAAMQQSQSRRRLPHQQLEAESDSSSEASLQGQQLVADDEEESDSSPEASVQHSQSQRTIPVPQPANNAEDESESESSSEPSTPTSNARVSPDAGNSTEEGSDSDSEASVVRPQPQSHLKVREADESDTSSDIDDAGSLPDQAKGARVEAEEALQSEDESESEVPREMSRSSSETSQRSNDLAKSTQHGDDIEDSYIPTQRSLFG